MLKIAGKLVDGQQEVTVAPKTQSRFVANCGCGALYDGPSGQEALRLVSEHFTATGHTASLHGEVR